MQLAWVRQKEKGDGLNGPRRQGVEAGSKGPLKKMLGEWQQLKGQTEVLGFEAEKVREKDIFLFKKKQDCKLLPYYSDDILLTSLSQFEAQEKVISRDNHILISFSCFSPVFVLPFREIVTFYMIAFLNVLFSFSQNLRKYGIVWPWKIGDGNCGEKKCG